jgi:hypothetical protein
MVYMKASDGYVFKTTMPQYHPSCEKLTLHEGKRQLREQSKKELLRYFKRKDANIYAIIRRVSSTGMTRYMDFYVIDKGAMRCITHRIADVLDWRIGKGDALIVTGCGMDMVFHTVSSVASALGVDYSKVSHTIL